MIPYLFFAVYLFSHFQLVLVYGQVQEATLVASSPFRMAISPTFSKLTQGTLDLIRVTAVDELQEVQSKSDLAYLLNRTKIVLQADLQVGDNVTAIHFFALTTQMAISVPPGTAFLEVRQRDADNRRSTLNDFVEAAMGRALFIERLKKNAKVAFGKGDGLATVNTVSQILAIERIVVEPAATASDIPDGLKITESIETKKLSTLDILLIVVIVAIFFAVVYFVVQLRRESKKFDVSVQSTFDLHLVVVESNSPTNGQLGADLVIVEESAVWTRSDSPEEKATHIDVHTVDSYPSTISAPSPDTFASDTKIILLSDNDGSSISTPSLCSSKSAASRASSVAKSHGSNQTAEIEVKASHHAASTSGLQAVSLIHDDVSDVVGGLLNTTLGGTINGHEILAETSTVERAHSRSVADATSTKDEIAICVESLAESCTSDFFESEESSSEGDFRGRPAHLPSSSSSYYSSSASTSSEDLFNVDVEAASKKSGSIESKQSSAASVKDWLKTVQVLSGSATTDSKTTSSSQERSSVSSLTAASMAASIGVSTLEMSLSRLDRQAKKSVIQEDEECVEV